MSMSPSLVRVAAGSSVLEVFIIVVVVLLFAEATAFQAVVVTERSDFFAGGCGQRLVLDTTATASAKVADGATRRKHGPYEKEHAERPADAGAVFVAEEGIVLHDGVDEAAESKEGAQVVAELHLDVLKKDGLDQ
uniref:ORF7 n=1 Tax=Human cytomegalovirus TaxID=10359 RepID=Q6RXD8_HCMV|nr:ORF7 [Human betaherpesvirus 5]